MERKMFKAEKNSRMPAGDINLFSSLVKFPSSVMFAIVLKCSENISFYEGRF